MQDNGGPSVNRTLLYLRNERLRFDKIPWQTVLREPNSSMFNEEFIDHMSHLTEVPVVSWVIRPDGQGSWKVNPSYVEANGIVQPRVRLFRSWNEQMRHYIAKSHRLFERNQRHRHGLLIQYHNVEVDYIDSHTLREMYARVPA